MLYEPWKCFLLADYKSYARLAPPGKMKLVLDVENGAKSTHLETIAGVIEDDWDKTVAPALGLTEGEIEEIRKTQRGKLFLQK